jgi:hypothetical protein
MFVQAIFAHFGPPNPLFEQNATEREKRRDWLAEKIGFELVVAFRRTIALYWQTKCVFLLSAANREFKPENRSDCTVQDRQCETKG